MEFLACTAFDVTRDEPLHIEVIYFELRFEVEEFPWEMFSFFSLFSKPEIKKFSQACQESIISNKFFSPVSKMLLQILNKTKTHRQFAGNCLGAEIFWPICMRLRFGC